MLNKLLEGLKILDLTTRLPGPFGSNILEHFGAKVIKLESLTHGDQFNNPDVYSLNPCFKDWYTNLNSNKTVLKKDFSNTDFFKEDIFKNIDALLLPDSKKIRDYIKDLPNPPKVIIKLSGGIGEWKNLHDLNALSFVKVFSLHFRDAKTPPFLPIAGISFGQYIATAILASLLKAKNANIQVEETIYLKDTTEYLFNLFHSESFEKTPTQLHNGAFPCYNTYRTQDNKIVCLAAVEEKYWKGFREVFELNLKNEDRFDLSEKTSKLLEKTFSNLDTAAIREKTKNKDICLTIIE